MCNLANGAAGVTLDEGTTVVASRHGQTLFVTASGATCLVNRTERHPAVCGLLDALKSRQKLSYWIGVLHRPVPFLKFGQPAETHCSTVSGSNRISAPKRIGAGALPASTNRRIWRVEQARRRARSSIVQS